MFKLIGTEYCPKTHPYAYMNGGWCCQTNLDCEGQFLENTSLCCQHYAYKKCPVKKCKNNSKGFVYNHIINHFWRNFVKLEENRFVTD